MGVMAPNLGGPPSSHSHAFYKYIFDNGGSCAYKLLGCVHINFIKSLTNRSYKREYLTLLCFV